MHLAHHSQARDEFDNFLSKQQTGHQHILYVSDAATPFKKNMNSFTVCPPLYYYSKRFKF